MPSLTSWMSAKDDILILVSNVSSTMMSFRGWPVGLVWLSCISLLPLSSAHFEPLLCASALPHLRLSCCCGGVCEFHQNVLDTDRFRSRLTEHDGFVSNSWTSRLWNIRQRRPLRCKSLASSGSGIILKLLFYLIMLTNCIAIVARSSRFRPLVSFAFRSPS